MTSDNSISHNGWKMTKRTRRCNYFELYNAENECIAKTIVNNDHNDDRLITCPYHWTSVRLHNISWHRMGFESSQWAIQRMGSCGCVWSMQKNRDGVYIMDTSQSRPMIPATRVVHTQTNYTTQACTNN